MAEQIVGQTKGQVAALTKGTGRSQRAFDLGCQRLKLL